MYLAKPLFHAYSLISTILGLDMCKDCQISVWLFQFLCVLPLFSKGLGERHILSTTCIMLNLRWPHMYLKMSWCHKLNALYKRDMGLVLSLNLSQYLFKIERNFIQLFLC